MLLTILGIAILYLIVRQAIADERGDGGYTRVE